MPKHLWRLLPFVLLMLLAIFLYRGLSLDPKLLPSKILNQPAPTLGSVNKDMENKVWLLNVWATWCQACQAEHGLMLELKKEGINIVGLDYKDEDAAAKSWLANLGDPYLTVVADPDGRLAIDWGVYGAPETFIIDKQGIIRYKYVGTLTRKAWLTQIKPVVDKLS